MVIHYITIETDKGRFHKACIPLIREGWPYKSVVMSTMHPTTVDQDTAREELTA